MASTASTTPTPGSLTYPSQSFKDFILDFVDKKVFPIVPETAILSPVLLIGGAAIFSLITLNSSLAMLAFASLFAMGMYELIHKGAGYFTSPTFGAGASPASSEKCKSSFLTLTPSRFSALLDEGLRSSFPNQSLYFIVFAIFYTLMSMFFYGDEINALGEKFGNRFYLSVIGSSLFLLLFFLYLYLYQCDSFGVLLGSVVVGGLVGAVASVLNNQLFGKWAVNVLFLPELADRKGMDYVCATIKR